MFARILPVLACALCLSVPAISQAPAYFDLEQEHLPFATLSGPWHFHPGDDPAGILAYADPGFDDSGWSLIRGNHSWDTQGYKGLSGVAWYRAKIRIPAGKTKLALYVRRIDDSSQIFLDGQLIGSFGAMPPHPRADFQIKRLYPLPLQPSSQARVVTLAIRVWHWPHWAAKNEGGIRAPIRLGDAAFLRLLMNLGIRDDAWDSVDDIVLIFLWDLTGIAALGLFALRRDREYLWFGLYLLVTAALSSFNTYIRFHAFGSQNADLVRNLIVCAMQLTQIAFYYYLLRGKRNWLFWTAIVSSGIIAPLFQLLLHSDYGNYATWNLVIIALSLPFRVWILTLLFQRTRQGMPDARLLLAPVLLYEATSISATAILAARYLNWRGNISWFYAVSEWPFRFSLPDLADLFFLIAMAAIFLYRFNRTSREQEDLKREREAARTVQQILVPEAFTQVPGFHIDSIYSPAGEVGGDFFQILPLANGSVLIVIGDVSGKGLPAAMTVSLLVGAVRTLADFTQSPGKILAIMNQRMLGRSSGGFTTCLILRADLNGSLTLANAGHIHPYLDGQELPAENGLPLGLADESFYAESTSRLDPSQQLTLVTDGVVEATNPSGELYGFERTAALSTQSAGKIVHAARQWGQEDDITVLTLTRLAQTA